MVKGVSKQVLELSTPPGDLFERVLFFIKPEFTATSEGALQERAVYIAQSAGLPPTQRIKKDKRRMVWAVLGAALAGVMLGAAGVLFVVMR